MQAVLETDARRFAGRVLPWVAAEPVLHNVLATNVEAARDGRRTFDDALWMMVVDDGEIVGVAHHTPPYGLLICPMPATAAQVLAQAVSAVRPRLVGVNGVTEAAEAFARAWGRRTGATVTPGMQQRLYELATLVPPPDAPGRARLATTADNALLVGWYHAFLAEAVPQQASEGVSDVVAARTAEGQQVIWEVGGRPVCFAAASPPAAGVSRIGPVYTPPADRRHGYASACVAAASQRALDSGALRCMLYTDLANPTSNSIYQQVGYRPVADARQWTFTPADQDQATRPRSRQR